MLFKQNTKNPQNGSSHNASSATWTWTIPAKMLLLPIPISDYAYGFPSQGDATIGRASRKLSVSPQTNGIIES